MSKFNSIEEMKVWQEAMSLVLSVYDVIRRNKEFSRDFGLRDQVQRSAVSIPSNIAEGFERETNAEFVRFLYIAKGSSGELRIQIYIAHKLGYVLPEDYTTIDANCRKISSMLMKLIHTLKP